MIRFDARLVLATALLGLSTPSLAFFDGQIIGGQRAGKWDYTDGDGEKQTKTINGTEVGAAFHIDPFKMIPISLGVGVYSQSYDLKTALGAIADDFAEANGIDATAKGTITGMTYGPELMAWIPIPFVKPYVRVGYLMGTYKETTDVSLSTPAGFSPVMSSQFKSTTNYEATGSSVGLGVRFAPLPLLGVLVEYAINNETHKVKDVTYEQTDTTDGVATTSKDTLKGSDLAPEDQKVTWGTRSIRLGIQIGF